MESTDCIAFIAVNSAFILFVLVALIRDVVRIKSPSVIRGEISRRKYSIIYGFLSIIFIQLIQVSSAFEGHKVLISIIDLGALFYLTFYNGWFRNWILGKFIIYDKRTE